MSARPAARGGRIPRVMLVTPGDAASDRIVAVAAAAARGGVDTIVVREPRLTDRALVRLVEDVLAAVSATGARVVVNERFDVALVAGAAGVHLKSSGLDPAAVREQVDALAPPGFLVGVSTHRASELAEASRAGAVDYCCVGPLHATGEGKLPLEADGLRRLLEEARRAGPLAPFVVLGGVQPADAGLVAGLAAAGEQWGLAAIRPFFGAESEAAAEAAARAFADLVPPGLEGG